MSSNVLRYDNVISLVTRQSIANRYHTVTKAINREFWNSMSETTHSFYVGSYGRNTAINTSDIDILVEIPEYEYNKYSYSKWNGQSRLLQAVKKAIETSYSRSDVRADGQVIKIAFSDGMKFEVLPAFPQTSCSGSVLYKYPDTNMGGNWRTTDPKSEQKAMKEKNWFFSFFWENWGCPGLPFPFTPCGFHRDPGGTEGPGNEHQDPPQL